jgi:hypothetical protein
VIRVGEGPTTADRHETRVAHFREDHIQLIAPTRASYRRT